MSNKMVCRGMHLESPISGDSESIEPDSLVVVKQSATSDNRKQFIAALASCVGPVAMGSILGYTSPAMEQLRNRFHLGEQEASLIGSVVAIGALFGGLIAGVVTDYFGRKTVIMLNCIPYILAWLLTIAAQNVGMLYCSRILSGICVGITCLSCPVYITEIATPEVRGVLGSFFQLFVNIGIMLAYVLGKYLDWDRLALVLIFIPAIQVVVMMPIPESPSWLIRNKRRLEALESLKWLRGSPVDVVAECTYIENLQSDDATMAIKDFTKPILFKPLLLMFALMFGQQFSGVNAIIMNAVDIFKNATTAIDPHDAAIIVGTCAVVSSIAAFALVDRAGRKILLIASAVVMALSMFALGFYDYEKQNDPQVADAITWLPIANVIVFVMAFNLGFGPIPWLMMSEVFPNQARGIASSIVTAFNWTMAFTVIKTFVDFQNAIHDYGIFWLFGSVCTVMVALVIRFVPETKGKSIEEILSFFAPGTEVLF